MTNAIEVTKRAMQSAQKEMLNDKYHDPFDNLHYRLNDKKFGVFEQAYEAHLECLRQEIEGLRDDVKLAERNYELRGFDLEDKKSLLITAGDELRRAQSLNRSYARQLAGTEESPALMTILGALVNAQRIMTDWLVPDGVRARDTVKALLPVLDSEILVLAMRSFEKTKTGE